MASFKFCILSLVLLLITERGLADPCDKSSVVLQTFETGKTVKGQPEYWVTVANGCICKQSNVIVACDGFNSVEPVNPDFIKKIGKNGTECLLNSGKPFRQADRINFKYAQAEQVSFDILKSDIKCPFNSHAN